MKQCLPPNAEKYCVMIIEENRNIIKNLKNKGDPKQDTEVFLNIIFNQNGPRQFQGQHTEKDIFFVNRIFWPMSEIFSTMWAIENILVYMNTFPYGRHKISKVSYLKYHIENFLNEVYILEKRVEAYSTIVERGYKKESNSVELQNIMKKLREYASHLLKNTINKRGYHIHRNRYSDRDLDHLSSLELYSKFESDREDQQFWSQRDFFERAYKDVRRKKIKEFKGIVEKLWDMLELYFKIMWAVVSKKGKFVYPSDK